MTIRVQWFAVLVVVLAIGCGGKDANTKLCLDDFAKLEKQLATWDKEARSNASLVYQTCGISCDITKDSDACKAFKTTTEVLCEKEGEALCKELCEGSNGKKNETACSYKKQ